MKWVLLAVLLAVLGTVTTAVSAHWLAQRDSRESRQAFERSSAVIASTLHLVIQRDNDLTRAGLAFFVDHPDATNAEFARWAEHVRAFDEYPELIDAGFVVIVPDRSLAGFVEQVKKDPILAPRGVYTVSPPGQRPFYCLAATGVARKGTVQPTPVGLDMCATAATRATFLGSRDSGLSSYVPFSLETGMTLAVETPVYRGGVTPKTLAARREQFLGALGLVTSAEQVLARALTGHPNMAVSLRYRAGASGVAFAKGTIPHGATSATIDLHNGWTVVTYGQVNSGGLFGSDSALALLISGVLLSLLGATLVLVLSTSRARALGLVRMKTDQLRHQALHDGLTGLPNRTLIMDRADQLLRRARRQGTSVAALFIDLDDFKDVNDTLGHEAGDRLLVSAAGRMRACLRDADTIGRMGGDEFVVLIDQATLDVAPEMVAQRLLDVMRQPYELESSGSPLSVKTSIGIAVGDRAEPDDLIRDADVALYQAKAAGKNGYVIFQPGMHSSVTRRIELAFDLRTALDQDQFRLVYQPIYQLNSLTMVGVEALLRWHHPRLGLILPDEFIPILEQTGQIIDVGRWVLRQACEQMADWHSRGKSLDISVNVSGRQLDDDRLVNDVATALEDSGLPATSLIIEVTETSLMRDLDAAVRRLSAIKNLGVRVAIDDFGTGYASLAYLHQLPVDSLKIDRMFTTALATSPDARALVATLVQLGKDLGLTTLAEGVETLGEMDLLEAEHVNEAQGFLFAKPLAPHDLERRFGAPAHITHAASHRR